MNNKDTSEVTKAYRAAIGDRATWFYLLLKNAEEMGIDGEKLAEKAITQFGVEKGRRLGKIENASDFVDALFSGYGCGAFAMEKVAQSPQESVLRFHHCALVDAWQKRGLGAEEISRLCRLARFGDLGMVSNFSNLTLAFPKVLADGDDYCELKVACSSK
ncbi:MAG: L-2-amino-thiazoline-4-carboxylic acid hydrolase [Dethiobacter sp.]|jgi:hypothetical protein|nr:L-2-amino-thiazoline-4-carboxylic acid hydrolase [Dethiobacter sp.]